MSRIEEPLNVRTYVDKELEDEKLYKILQLAMQVPSSSNQHPWELLIIKNKETLKNLSISTPYAWIVQEASCAIIVLGNMNKTVFKEIWDQDCSAVTEGILLGSMQQKLGAFWLGVYPYEERMNYISDILDLPDEVVPFSVIPLGYLSQNEVPRKLFLDEKIHYEKWSKK